MKNNEAYVVKIGKRYFCRFGKNWRIQTAWCLAGAKLFLYDVDAQNVMSYLTLKGYQCEFKTVVLKDSQDV